ncbi:MAG: hypothetical protein CMJ40_08655 [Phycisphaerae bacterium]|nr:hypothetical protein [Phycisphaerae bacterium]|tara:strand:- start:46 stop:1794 length:1749 start_codon:yes stop_codon:yes gene_type:complete
MTSEQRPEQGIHVVIVDDQVIVGEAVRRMLSGDEDITLEAIMDPSLAMDRIRAIQPNVLLVDLVMPGIDGLELTRRLQADESTRDIPIIILSSESDVHRKVDAFENGASDFLVKMPDRLELVARVRALAAKAIAEQQLRLMATRLQKQAVALDEANRSLQAMNVSLESDVSEQRGRLRSIAMLSNELARIQDIDILTERLLTEARRILVADAGASYLVDADQLRLTHAQNGSFEAQDFTERLRDWEIAIDHRSIVGWVAETGEVANIRDAYELDETSPYQFNDAFDKKYGYHTRSIMAAPLIGATGQVMGVLQLINPCNPDGTPREQFDADDETAIRHFASMASVSMQNAQLTRSMILRMIRMAELRDPSETGAHANRVAEYALVVFGEWAQRHGLTVEERELQRDRLRIAAMLHDVGKVAVPDMILKKPGKLDDREFATMQGHTMVDEALFDELLSGYDEAAAEVVRGHHERWDGKGYPGRETLARDDNGYLVFPTQPIRNGREGDEIPLFARIVAIADVFDALGSQRSYKEAWDDERILSLLREESGSHFDPELVAIFIDRIDEIRAIRAKWSPVRSSEN